MHATNKSNSNSNSNSTGDQPHANADQLLAIIDGEQVEISQHVSSCERCQISLTNLQSFKSEVGLQMFDAADQVPSSDVWGKIQRSLDQCSSQEGRQSDITQSASNVHRFAAVPQHSLSKPIYALAASIAFIGIVSVFMFSQQQNNQLQTQIMQESLNELMLNSRGLESVLQKVADQNLALNVANQQAADRLYWRLTYVDQLINQASPENTERMEVLWNDRIEALNALNQIYYQQESTLNASEI